MSKALRDERFSKDIQMLNGMYLNLVLSATKSVLDDKASGLLQAPAFQVLFSFFSKKSSQGWEMSPNPPVLVRVF